jgi:hypothetical protein
MGQSSGLATARDIPNAGSSMKPNVRLRKVPSGVSQRLSQRISLSGLGGTARKSTAFGLQELTAGIIGRVLAKKDYVQDMSMFFCWA